MSPTQACADFVTTYSRPETRRAYLADVSDFLNWCSVADVDPLEASRVDVNGYRDYLVALGSLQATSIDRKLTACRSFYRYLQEEGMVSANWFTTVSRLATPGESTTAWPDEDEMKKLLVTARDWHVRDFVLIGLMGLNGLRVSEAVGADAKDLGHAEGQRTLRIIGKGQKIGLVPLAPELEAAIDEVLQGRTAGPIVPALNRRGGISGPVAPISREAAYKRVKQLVEWAGVNPDLSPHSLRHGFITHALNGGAELHVVQLAAHHSDPATTMRYKRGALTLKSNPSVDLANRFLERVA
jgi:integrase/recombinase XerD